MRVAIIGGGAAGMLCAATLAEKTGDKNNADIFLIEKNSILGRKVIISGGGRCNVTTGIENIDEVLEKYPRGKNFLKFAMYNFPPKAVKKWFEDHGVPLKIEPDLRVFPKSNDGKDVVKVFENIFANSGVEILLKNGVKTVEKKNEIFLIHFENGETLEVDKLVITTGGQAYRQTGSTGDGYLFAEDLGHTITELAPSLNAFLLQEPWVKSLAGVSFKKAKFKIDGQKNYQFEGPFVFTHKGVSGPAIFAMSSLAAHELADEKKPVPMFIDFMPELSYEELTNKIKKNFVLNPKKKFITNLDFLGPRSLMQVLCAELKINEKKLGAEISKNELNKTVSWLKNLTVTVIGRAPGEEFVTAGGVSLKEVDSKTMQSKICPNLFFAGEILDIDGFTGGFNLQAAWATGRLAGESI